MPCLAKCVARLALSSRCRPWPARATTVCLMLVALSCSMLVGTGWGEIAPDEIAIVANRSSRESLAVASCALPPVFLFHISAPFFQLAADSGQLAAK